jgi:CDP-glycerol glycerophosphotransferase
MAAVAPEYPVSFVLDERHERTGTSQSLLKALRASGPGGVLWLDGDLVFDGRLLGRLAALMATEQSFVCVNGPAATGDEALTSTVDGQGLVTVVSRSRTGGLGEAVGINYIASQDKQALVEHLEGCADQDRFERGIERALTAGLRIRPVDTGEFFAVKVDSAADLERADQEVSRSVTSAA